MGANRKNSKAQLLRRWDAERAVERPLDVVETLEITGGFISKQYSRVYSESPRQRDTLLLSSGKLRRIMVHPFSQSDSLQ